MPCGRTLTFPAEELVVDAGRSSGLRAIGRGAPNLLTVASQLVEPVLMTAFVPVYRCGAALEFHQVPSCRAGREDRRTRVCWSPR